MWRGNDLSSAEFENETNPPRRRTSRLVFRLSCLFSCADGWIAGLHYVRSSDHTYSRYKFSSSSCLIQNPDMTHSPNPLFKFASQTCQVKVENVAQSGSCGITHCFVWSTYMLRSEAVGRQEVLKLFSTLIGEHCFSTSLDGFSR